MRTGLAVIAVATLSLLAACGPKEKPVEPPPEVTAPVAEEAPAFNPLTGIFTATSTTAMGITGDLSVIAERVTLAKGEQFETAPATSISSTTKIAADGKSFAETYVGPVNLQVELRKVTGSSVAEGTTPQKLCGRTPVTYLAFAYDEGPKVVSMLAFSGEDAPGDTATKSSLCGTFAYGS